MLPTTHRCPRCGLCMSTPMPTRKLYCQQCRREMQLIRDSSVTATTQTLPSPTIASSFVVGTPGDTMTQR